MLQVKRGKGLINMNLLQVALNFISYFMKQKFQIDLPSIYQLIRLKNWKFTEYVSAKSALELRHCVQNTEIFGVRIFIMVMFSIQKSSFRLTETSLSYIIEEWLNWYWWIWGLVVFKTHSPDCAFLQTTSVNFHKHQFNNPIIFGVYDIWGLYTLPNVIRLQ